MRYYAHSISDSDKPWQTMADHLNNTAKLAKNNASAFKAGNFGYICGLLHDLGKYSPSFQQKLLGRPLRVDHSTAGAQEAIKVYGKAVGQLLAYCIAGHHSGLLDYGTPASTEGTLYARLHKDLDKEIGGYDAYKSDPELQLPNEKPQIPVRGLDDEHIGFRISFFTRMLFSCLVDADFLDTERYMSDEIKPRGKYESIQELGIKLESFLSRFAKLDTAINIKRSE